MVEFKEGNIFFKKGDTAHIDIVILTPTGDIYELQEGDTVVFSLKTNKCGPNNKVVLSKQFEGRILNFEPTDTKFLREGSYYYSSVLTIAENGDVQTLNEGTLFLKG